MNPSLENPFRPTNKGATKRLFKVGHEKQETTKILSKAGREKIEKYQDKIVEYGPHQILESQVKFLKQLEKLIPEYVLGLYAKIYTAKELVSKAIKSIEDGKILHLNLQRLNLSDLPKLPNSLLILDCGINKLKNLPPLPASLKALYCGGNQLTKLPDLPQVLQKLDCAENQLNALPNLPKSLQWLICFKNHLTSLPELPHTLEVLRCYNNSLDKKTIKRIISHKNYNTDNFIL